MVQSFSPDFTVGILRSFLRGVRLFPGGVRLSGCLQFTGLPARKIICLPVWLVVFQTAYYWGSQFSLKWFPPVCRCWCPRLRMSFFTKKVSRHLSPVWLVVASIGQLSRCLNVCLHLFPFICLPAWLVVSGSLEVLLPSVCLLVVSGSQDVRFYLVSSSADVSLYLSPFICHLSPDVPL